MYHHTFQRISGRLLLGAAGLWLVGVTLCSTRTFDIGQGHPVVAHEDAHGSHHPADKAGHHEKQSDGCGCESFNAFPAQSAALAKAPVPADAFLIYTIFPEEVTYVSISITVTAQNTGPPGRIAADKLILQRCHLSHAPPFVV